MSVTINTYFINYILYIYIYTYVPTIPHFEFSCYLRHNSTRRHRQSYDFIYTLPGTSSAKPTSRNTLLEYEISTGIKTEQGTRSFTLSAHIRSLLICLTQNKKVPQIRQFNPFSILLRTSYIPHSIPSKSHIHNILTHTYIDAAT